MVVGIARRYAKGDEVSIEDLVQEGMIAALRSFRSWSPEGGASPSTWVYGSIKTTMHKFSRRCRRAGATKRGKQPRGEPPPECPRFVSLDAPLRDESDSTLHDILGAEDDHEDTYALDRLPELVRGLCPRDREIITLRFFRGWTLQQVADKVGRSREWIRQREAEALARLRRALTE